MQREVFEKEKQKLEEVKEITAKVIKEEENDLDDLMKDLIKNKKDNWVTIDRKKLHIKNLEKSRFSPYFARVDFINDESNITAYIGKTGIIDGSDIVVTDWRAPISSLYYESEIGAVTYEVSGVKVNGEMPLKRQYVIEEGKLTEYFDVDLVSGDALLQKYLNSNNDSRLKSVVSTIQKEQNEVIRRKLSENIIIDGVAGSGKTTVALHRIAYLVYNYIKTINAESYLVIGPNEVFLKYIKSVLPDLDVSNVTELTYEEFTKKYIEENIKILPSSFKVKDKINGITSSIDKYKCSLEYKELLDKYLNDYINKILQKPLEIEDFIVLNKDIIKEEFLSSLGVYTRSITARIEKTTERLAKYINANYHKIKSRYDSHIFSIYSNAQTEEERNIIKNKIKKDTKELNSDCKNLLKEYFKDLKCKPTKIYKEFLNSINDENLTPLKEQTLKNINKNTYEYEDLAALIYIKSYLNPNKKFTEIRHVVIDEAQDLGLFNYYVMKKALPNATFSIYGDLAQSIYDYRSVTNFDEVKEKIFNNEAEIIGFTKSYRTTNEIMSVANKVAKSINLKEADLVIRSGKEVNFIKTNEIANLIKAKVNDAINDGYNTIAIISKTEEMSGIINKELKKIGLDIPNVEETDDLTDKKFKICTISNYLSKGLEFDAVIINDASEEIYSSNNDLDMKLLYVAITRALHELTIIYNGDLTKPLLK